MKEKNKHDHRATKCLKTIIFSILMLAPFLAVGSKVAYTTFNKNAYESYRGSYQYDATLNLPQLVSNIRSSDSWSNYNSINDFSYFNTTITSYLFETTNENIEFYTLTWFSIDKTTLSENIKSKISTNTYNNVKSIGIKGTANGSFLINFYNIDLDTLDHNPSWDSNLQSITFKENFSFITYNDKIYSRSGASTNPLFNFIYSHTFITDTTLSSVFYSAVDELDDASIFSWTTNTMIYSSVTGMTEGLGIVSPPLAVLITYWTILTSIYVIIDIVLEMFIFLTHWASDKL